MENLSVIDVASLMYGSRISLQIKENCLTGLTCVRKSPIIYFNNQLKIIKCMPYFSHEKSQLKNTYSDTFHTTRELSTSCFPKPVT